jgi:hypothetical protein
MKGIRAAKPIEELEPTVDANYRRDSGIRVINRPVVGALDREGLRTPMSSDRPSEPHSLDDYDPDVDVVAPLSLRCAVMQLLWVCGDCGEHYVRAQECPTKCDACGAPREHFYAPIED